MNKQIHLMQGCTCVITRNDETVFESRESGIKPLIDIIEQGVDVSGCDAFDKIVGKAAAMLYSYMRVSRVLSEVMSRKGLEVLQGHGISAEYDALTDRIINRRGDDICPMERAVENISSVDEALRILIERSRELKEGERYV